MFAAVWRWFYAADFKRRAYWGGLASDRYVSVFPGSLCPGLKRPSDRLSPDHGDVDFSDDRCSATSVVTYGEPSAWAGTWSVNGLPLIGLDVAEGFLLLGWIYLAKGSLSESVSAPEYAGHLRGDSSRRVDRENQSPPGRLPPVPIGRHRTGQERLKKIILEADAVILSDISDEVRNALIKFCYRRGIRVYVTPKISGSDSAGRRGCAAFYTPLSCPGIGA